MFVVGVRYVSARVREKTGRGVSPIVQNLWRDRSKVFREQENFRAKFDKHDAESAMPNLRPKMSHTFIYFEDTIFTLECR